MHMNRFFPIHILFTLVAFSLIGLIAAAPLLDHWASVPGSCVVEEVQEGIDSDSETLRPQLDFVGLSLAFCLSDHLFQPKFVEWLALDLFSAESTATTANSQRGPPSFFL
jgi:hypothetical protein